MLNLVTQSGTSKVEVFDYKCRIMNGIEANDRRTYMINGIIKSVVSESGLMEITLGHYSTEEQQKKVFNEMITAEENQKSYINSKMAYKIYHMPENVTEEEE